MSDQNSTGRSSPIAQSQLVEFIHLIYSSSLEQLRLVQHSLGKGEQSVYSYNQAQKLHSPIIVGLHTLLHCAMSTVLTLVVVEDRKEWITEKIGARIDRNALNVKRLLICTFKLFRKVLIFTQQQGNQTVFSIFVL